MNILQASTYDILGGAERVAWELFRGYRARGHGSWLAVGKKLSTDDDVLPLEPRPEASTWQRRLLAMRAGLLQSPHIDLPGAWRLSETLQIASHPARAFRQSLGWEEFGFPATRHLLDLPPEPPDLLHCHNLHGGYFDLRALPELSRRVPVVLTLHDAWMLSGHCAHSFTCERWKTGCGRCPDLSLYPAVRRDATAANWRRKKRIYSGSRLYVATPSQWLLDKVRRSILAPAVVDGRVVPNGVDLATFTPGPRQAARAALGIPQDAVVCLSVANGLRQNPWKDFGALQSAVALCAEHLRPGGREVLWLVLGDEGPPESLGRATVRYVPRVTEAAVVARYFQAADVCLHAAKADTFPNVVLESLACGTPVVATAVGGIPEQVRSLRGAGAATAVAGHGPDAATGMLVEPGNPVTMAAAAATVIRDPALALRLGTNAAADARRRFSLERQIDTYLDWYTEILEGGEATGRTGASASAEMAHPLALRA